MQGQKFDVDTLANALYEGTPALSNLAETLARQFGKAGALSFYQMMGPDVQFFWQDIARQLIAHAGEWQDNEGSCCKLSKRESERLRAMREACEVENASAVATLRQAVFDHV